MTKKTTFADKVMDDSYTRVVERGERVKGINRLAGKTTTLGSFFERFTFSNHALEMRYRENINEN